jgi:hypothetical protein
MKIKDYRRQHFAQALAGNTRTGPPPIHIQDDDDHAHEDDEGRTEDQQGPGEAGEGNQGAREGAREEEHQPGQVKPWEARMGAYGVMRQRLPTQLEWEALASAGKWTWPERVP